MSQSQFTKIYMSSEQKALLIALIDKRPHLVKGRFNSQFTHRDAQEQWHQIAEALNVIPNGALKTWKQWRKTWQDFKSNLKHKREKMRRERNLRIMNKSSPLPTTHRPSETIIPMVVLEKATIKRSPSSESPPPTDEPIAFPSCSDRMAMTGIGTDAIECKPQMYNGDYLQAEAEKNEMKKQYYAAKLKLMEQQLAATRDYHASMLQIEAQKVTALENIVQLLLDRKR